MGIRQQKTSVVLCGAAPDTRNLGVTALMLSVVDALLRRIEGIEVAVADHGTSVRPGVGFDRPGVRFGVQRTRRWYRPESTARIGLALRAHRTVNRSAQILRDADVILDLSAGDSFTDLYGSWRFQSIIWPKRAALRLETPLVLLPQTYGPFRDPRRRSIAADIVQRVKMAWARDERSFAVLQELAGEHFDSKRHRSGVDVAFALASLDPGDELLPAVREAIECRDEPVVGLNVSGLLWNNPDEAINRYGLKADYRRVIQRVIEQLLTANARVLLIPHVVTPDGHYESDGWACRSAAASINTAHRDQRVLAVPEQGDPRQVKWIIGQCDWFCGTRMHSTIAALSSGVPAAALSYSDKTLGVFEGCGQGHHVVDPRTLRTDEVVERLLASFQHRDDTSKSLARHLPSVLQAAETQMDEIAEVVVGQQQDCVASGLTGASDS